MKKILSVLSFILLFSACSVQPINPETGDPLLANSKDMNFEQKVGIQEEILQRQEQEKAKQERELYELRKQEYYNYRTERFK